MMNYFFKCNGQELAPIKASSDDEAYQLLEIEHAWIKANRNNSFLIKKEKI